MSALVDNGTRQRVVTWADPRHAAAQLSTMSGLAHVEAILQGQIPPPPVASLIGMDLESVEKGRAVFTLEIGEHLYNPIGTVHGGMSCTLLDSAMGCAVQSALPDGFGFTTLDLNVSFVRAITLAVPFVRAEGEVVSSGRRVATARGRIVGPDGTLYAHGVTTCLLFPITGDTSAK